MALQRGWQKSWEWLCTRKWERIAARIRYATVEFILLSIVVLVWVASYRLTLNVGLPSIEPGDLLTLLFGAASVALFAISFIVAIIAVIGWQGVNDLIQERTKTAVQQESERSYKELSGRLYSGLGLVFGRVSRPMDVLRANRPDLLDIAVDFSRDGYNILEEVKSNYSSAALNNLVFYLGVRGKREDAEFALNQAKTLWGNATKYERRQYALTYCRAALEYSDGKEKIKPILLDIQKDPTASTLDRNEASLYLREYFVTPAESESD